MGIHYPIGYSGYEIQFLKTFIELIDRFCHNCHTNKDVNGNCKKCPIGYLIYTSKRYMLEVHESLCDKKETKILQLIKKEIKKIEPHPCFDTYFIFDKKKPKDSLLKLRKLLNELEKNKNKKLKKIRKKYIQI